MSATEAVNKYEIIVDKFINDWEAEVSDGD